MWGEGQLENNAVMRMSCPAWWLELIILYCIYLALEWPGFEPHRSSYLWLWQPIPVFLPGKFHGQRSLAGYDPWSHRESDTTEPLSTFFRSKCCVTKQPVAGRFWECRRAAAWRNRTFGEGENGSHSVAPSSLQHHGLLMEISRQEYWSVLPFSSPGDLLDPGIEAGSPALQADSLLPELPNLEGQL